MRRCGQALADIFRFLGKAGKSVLLPLPVYSIHLEAVRSSKLNIDFYNFIDSSLSESIEQVYQADQHQFILLNFPNNPTGQLLDLEEVKKIYSFIDPEKTTIINDFVYADLLITKETPLSLISLISNYPNTLEYFSMSKSYSIPGWRVGALLGNDQLISKLKVKKTEADYGNFLPFQRAAALALN